MIPDPISHRDWGDPRLSQRIWNQSVISPSGCWIWEGGSGNSNGYVNVCIDSRTWKLHRLAYTLFIGEVPDGLCLDHLCHTQDVTCPGQKCEHRRCFNPNHLEPVTFVENVMRGRSPIAQFSKRTQCPKGHPYDEQNTHITRKGRRACRECGRLYALRKRKEARAS